MARGSYRTIVLWTLPIGLLALGYFVGGPMLIRANQAHPISGANVSPNANPENETSAPKHLASSGPEVSVDAAPVDPTKPKPVKHRRRKAPAPGGTPSATPGSTTRDEGGSGGAAG